MNIYQRCSHDGSEPGIHIASLANLDAFVAALQAESARQHSEGTLPMPTKELPPVCAAGQRA